MERTICNVETQAIESPKRKNFERFITKVTAAIKTFKITGAEDLSKIR